MKALSFAAAAWYSRRRVSLIRLCLLLLITAALAGCDGANREDRSSSQQPGNSGGGRQQQTAPAGDIPPKSSDPNLEDNRRLPDPAGESPPIRSPDLSGDTVRQETPDTTPQPSSALDQAIETVTNQPEVVPLAETGIEPAEPHEELRPLIQADWVRLHPGYEVWLDMPNKQVVVGGRVCFRDGPLEMFACPMHTKEHESIIATVSDAEIVHTGLLAVGAIPGKPFQWDPQYVPASGPVVHINVAWTDDGQRQEIRAQEMVRDVVNNEPLQHDWVFCGSGEWRDPENPEIREYFANGGDMICVTNFSTAMLDLQIESSSMQEGLRYHANPEKIPELGKPVLLFLKPEPGEDELSGE